MSIKFCRIDDRLIHGQVITTWVNVHNIEQIIILDEAVVRDKIQSSVLKMSAPPNIRLHIFSPEHFLEVIEKNPIRRATMLLFSSVFDVLYLAQRGFHFDALNVGGMRLQGERVQITKAVSLNEEEKEAFRALIDRGIDVEIQMVPSNDVVKMKGVL